tara:strand:- start:223 stop:1563 length:1341 start_codon:yes stop_codon:yes gene_type:complete
MIGTECGIISISNKECNENIYENAINCLEKLQHRGTESCGILYNEDRNLQTYKNLGLVKDVFVNYKCKSKSLNLLGHVRYSTSGKSKDKSLIQPMVSSHNYGITFNGNIHNYDNYNKKVSNDTLFICEWLDNNFIKTDNIEKSIINFISFIKGAYCIIILYDDCIYAFKDSYGIRPLCIGKTNNSYIVASESSCFPEEYDYIREIDRGEIIKIKNNELCSVYKDKNKKNAFCLFEYIYFLRGNSIINNKKIEDFRYYTGFQLGKDEKNKIDKNNTISIGAPTTGIISAEGFADSLGIEHCQVLHKIKNSGRTFILPTNEERIMACNKRLYIDSKNKIKDKIIYLIDDSIVRGNTIKKIISLFYEANAKEVHVRIVSPPVMSPCYFGIDIPTKNELFINTCNKQQLHKELNCTSVKYIKLNKLQEYIKHSTCTSCFTGKYDSSLLSW